MTVEEVRKGLGLSPFDDFAAEQGAKSRAIASHDFLPIRNLNRQTGRTTRMIVSALAMASEGNAVQFEGETLRRTDQIVKMAKSYAHRLGIPEHLICAAYPKRGVLMFRDHSDN